MLRSFLLALAAVVATLAPAAPAAAAADVELVPGTPATVTADVRGGPVTVTVRARITSDTNVPVAWAFFRDPLLTGPQNPDAVGFDQLDGTGTDGTWETSMTFQPTAMPGDYALTVAAFDPDLNRTDFPVAFTVHVVSNVDVVAPALAEPLSALSTRLDVTERPGEAVLSAHLTDAHGIDAADVAYASSAGSTARFAFARASGTAQDGVWTATVVLPLIVADWSPRITARDTSGNESVFTDGPVLRTFVRPPAPVTPPVVSVPADTTAPVAAVTAARRASLATLRRGLRVAATCSEACAIRSQLLSGRTVLGRGSARLAAAGTQRLHIKLTPAGRRRVGRGRALRLTLRTTLTDAAGNARVVTRTISARTR